jgi:hypothetical protein
LSESPRRKTSDRLDPTAGWIDEKGSRNLRISTICRYSTRVQYAVPPKAAGAIRAGYGELASCFSRHSTPFARPPDPVVTMLRALSIAETLVSTIRETKRLPNRRNADSKEDGHVF